MIHIKVGNTRAPVDRRAKLNVQHVRNIVGTFYESLAAYIFDAERWEGGPIYANEKDRVRERDEGSRYRGRTPISLTPDLVRRKNSTFIEVKGGNARSAIKAYTWQSRLYSRIRYTAVAPISRPRVKYAFFLHDLYQMTKTLGTADKIVAGLARNTILALLVDLDVVLAFEGWSGTREYGDPEGHRYYPEFYNLSPWRLRALHAHPRCCLDEILGADQVHYRVTRTLIGSKGPQLDIMNQLVVDGTPLAPFTLVSIHRKTNSRETYTGPVDDTWLTRQQELVHTEPTHTFEPKPWGSDDYPF